MAEGNGDGIPLVVLGRRGRLRVQYDAKSPEVTLDTMVVSNQWAEIDASFRDEKGEIPRERMGEFQERALQFAQEALQVPEDAGMTWAEANHFLAVLTARSKELKAFFDSVSGDAPSSRASTELIFSEQEID